MKANGIPSKFVCLVGIQNYLADIYFLQGSFVVFVLRVFFVCVVVPVNRLFIFEKLLCPVFTILKMSEFLHMLDKCLILFPLLFIGVEAMLGEEKAFLNRSSQQE